MPRAIAKASVPNPGGLDYSGKKLSSRAAARCVACCCMQLAYLFLFSFCYGYLILVVAGGTISLLRERVVLDLHTESLIKGILKQRENPK